jgi:vanillate O-demethylase ferredoxin subunit
VAIARDKSVTEALREAGVEIPTSCEQGICGTCCTRVLEGEPDHKDLYLSPDEHAANDQFMPCCSRSKSPMLVLDL